jgi:hypothetical protein
MSLRIEKICNTSKKNHSIFNILAKYFIRSSLFCKKIVSDLFMQSRSSPNKNKVDTIFLWKGVRCSVLELHEFHDYCINLDDYMCTVSINFWTSFPFLFTIKLLLRLPGSLLKIRNEMQKFRSIHGPSEYIQVMIYPKSKKIIA